MNELRRASLPSDLCSLDWISEMLQLDPQQRLTPAQLRGKIMDVESQDAFICHYCSSASGIESLSPYIDSGQY